MYNNPVPTGESKLRKLLTEFLLPLAVAAAVYIGLSATMESRDVVGPSMLPNFRQGDYIMVSKVAYLSSKPQRGDVIVLHPVRDPGADLIKRIIALPGETIEVKKGRVFINGAALNEPYIKEPFTYDYPPWQVESGEYFVLGDNRDVSRDSHYGWTVPLNKIVGKVWFTYWPPSRMGEIPHYTYSLKK